MPKKKLSEDHQPHQLPPDVEADIQESMNRAKIALEAGEDLELRGEDPYRFLRESNPEAHNPPEVYTVGPRVIPPEKIVDRLSTEAIDAAPYWLERVRAPRRHAIREGIKAEGKWADKVKKAIDARSRAKALEKVTDERMGEALEAVTAGDFEAGVRRKKYKMAWRFGVLQPLYEMLAKILDTFPVDTDAQRAAKMAAARKGMIEIGRVRRGEIPVEEARRTIEGLRGR